MPTGWVASVGIAFGSKITPAGPVIAYSQPWLRCLSVTRTVVGPTACTVLHGRHVVGVRMRLAGRRLQHALEAEDDVVCSQRVAVLEVHALVQHERVHAPVLRDRPRLREQRLDLARLVELHEALVDVVQQHLGDSRRRVSRQVERRRRERRADRHRRGARPRRAALQRPRPRVAARTSTLASTRPCTLVIRAFLAASARISYATAESVRITRAPDGASRQAASAASRNARATSTSTRCALYSIDPFVSSTGFETAAALAAAAASAWSSSGEAPTSSASASRRPHREVSDRADGDARRLDHAVDHARART